MNWSISKDLSKKLPFNPLDLTAILKLINIDEESKKTIWVILNECKRLPASMNHHGNYKGGLYDHVLLVTNIVYYFWKISEFDKDYKDFFLEKRLTYSENYSELDPSKILRTALYHDFGKIPYHSNRMNLKNPKIIITEKLKLAVRKEIQERFNLSGGHPHVDEAIAILKHYRLPYDDEIYLSIIFHHGRWSEYKPFRGNKLSEVIHLADMVASHYYYI